MHILPFLNSWNYIMRHQCYKFFSLCYTSGGYYIGSLGGCDDDFHEWTISYGVPRREWRGPGESRLVEAGWQAEAVLLSPLYCSCRLVSWVLWLPEKNFVMKYNRVDGGNAIYFLVWCRTVKGYCCFVVWCRIVKEYCCFVVWCRTVKDYCYLDYYCKCGWL